MQIEIDVREHSLIEIFKQNSIEFIEKTLDLGDIILKNNNDEIIIFERKTVSDLASSIIDGRYKEQSFRLNSSNVPNHNIIYIIEGSLSSLRSHGKINKQVIMSCIVSMIYYKGFSVIKTSSILETFEYINTFYKKINKDGLMKDRIVNEDYVDVIKREKKANITQENIDLILLCQIPNVSTTSATAILNEFKTLNHLTNQLIENKECLNNIKIVNNSKERKISKKVIENITHYLCK